MTWTAIVIMFSAMVCTILALVEPTPVVIVVISVVVFILLIKAGPFTVLSLFLLQLGVIPLWINTKTFGLHLPIPVNLPLVFIILMFISTLWNRLIRRRGLVPFQIRPGDGGLLLLVIVCMLSIPKALDPQAVLTSYVLLFPVIIYFMIRFIYLDAYRMKRILDIVVISGVLLTLLLIIETALRQPFLSGMPMEEYSYGFAEGGVYQAGGPTDGPNTAGLYLALVMSVCGLLEINDGDKMLKKRYVFAFMTCLIGVMLTFSRSAWVAGVPPLIFVVNRWPSKGMRYLFWVTTTIVAILCIFVAFPERLFNIYNVQDRAVLADISWSVFLKNPIWGIGFENFRYLSLIEKFGLSKGPSHSLYTSLLVELGLVGAGVFLWWLCGCVRTLFSSKYAKQTLFNRTAQRFVLTILFSYLLAGFAHYTFTGFQATVLWFILLSLGMDYGEALSEVTERVDLL